MIKSKLLLNKKDEPIITQNVVLVCDNCGTEYSIKKYLTVKKAHQKYQKDLCHSCKMKFMFASGERKSSWPIYNKKQKGKTVEQRLGRKAGKIFRQKRSELTSGNKNPMFGRNDQCYKNGGLAEINHNKKGRTYEEIFGKKKAKEIKSKVGCSGIKNGMYGKPSPQGSGNGWSGWYKGFYFRSLLELSYLKYLFDNKIKFRTAETQEFKVEYKDLNGKKRNYFPDFYLEDTKEIIELKPKKLINSKQNKSKFDAAKKKFGKKFKIITDKNLNKLTSNEIQLLYRSKNFKWTDKYEQKFQTIHSSLHRT